MTKLKPGAPRMLRATITENEHRRLRAIAVMNGTTAAELVGQALRESPHTRAAFTAQTKETRDR